MKAAIVTTITGLLACAVIAAPVAQWVPPPPLGGFSISSPIGGVSIGPGGLYANGLLGGVNIGPQPVPYRPRQAGWGPVWNTVTGAEGETAQPKEVAAESAPAEKVEGTN